MCSATIVNENQVKKHKNKTILTFIVKYLMIFDKSVVKYLYEVVILIIVRLDRVMADRQMSLTELSEKTGISTVNLSRLKNGHVKSIRFSTLNALCTTLRCQPRDLLEFIYDL